MAEIIFTQDEMKELYDAEIHFISTNESNTLRNCPRWLVEKIKRIYEKNSGEKVNTNMSCSVCRFNLIKSVGKIYLSSKKYWEEQEKEVFNDDNAFKNSEQPQNDEQEKPKKKGRKKNEK